MFRYSKSVEPNPYLRAKIENAEKSKEPFERFLRSPVGKFLLYVGNNSSIHGTQYVLDRKLHVLERFIWLCLSILGVFMCLNITVMVYQRFQTSPTVISLERDYLSWNSTSPALTLCFPEPENETLDEVLKTHFPRTKDVEKLKGFLKTLYSLNFNNIPDVKLENHEDVSPEIYLKILSALHSFLEVGLLTSRGYQDFPMVQVIGEFGLCFSWFSNIASYISPKYWLGLNYTIESYNLTSSPLNGDMFAQVTEIDGEYTAYIHGANEVASPTDKTHTGINNSYKYIDTRVLTIYSTESVKTLRLKQRQCRFLDENPLKRSMIYTYNLCLVECRADLIVKTCGCIPHFYKKLSEERTCLLSELVCVRELRERLVSVELTKECKCLPNCDNDHYFVYNVDYFMWDRETSLTYGIKYYPRMRYKRGILFGFSDVLANVGGTLGLILGCSVLSLIEIVYFFTLRLFWYIKGLN